jgi:transcriptional regulator with XRE-family HTH domain
MFIKRIKEERLKKELSQAELAEKIGVTQQAVGKWETGKAMPDLATLRRLASFFDVTTDYLLESECDDNLVPSVIDHAEKMNLNDEQKAALEDYKKMPPDEQQRRLSIVLDKIKNLPAADQEALFRIINSLSSR